MLNDRVDGEALFSLLVLDLLSDFLAADHTLLFRPRSHSGGDFVPTTVLAGWVLLQGCGERKRKKNDYLLQKEKKNIS